MLKPLTVWITENCGKFLEMGILDHFTCLLRNLYVGQEAIVRTWQNRLVQNWERSIYIKAVYCHSVYAVCIMQNARLDDSQAGIKIARRNIRNLRYVDDTTLMVESEEELKSLLMREKEESEKVSLKLKIQELKSWHPSWQMDVEKWKQWQTLFSWAPKSLQMVTAAMKLKDACSLAEKPWQTYNSILKSRGITLLISVHIVKAMVFSSSHAPMWELDHKECWTPKNWCFQTVEKTRESFRLQGDQVSQS